MKQYIIYIICLIFLSSCGTTDRANRHLRRAEKHIRKAQILGAKISSDTTWKTIPILSPEIRFSTTLRPVNIKDTLIAKSKEGVITKVFIHKVDTVIKSVFIETFIPEQEHKAKVPIAVHQEISAGHGFWFDVKIVLVAAVAASIITLIFGGALKLWVKSLIYG